MKQYSYIQLKDSIAVIEKEHETTVGFIITDEYHMHNLLDHNYNPVDRDCFLNDLKERIEMGTLLQLPA